MKVHFNWGIASYSGSRDDMTYAAFRDGHVCIAKRWFAPTAGLNQEQIKLIAKNLASLWKSANPEYRADFKSYAAKYSHQHCKLTELPPSGYALYIMMMYNWYNADTAHVDLTAVTLGDIVLNDEDVCTVARAVGAGFLQPVTGYVAYTKEIQL